MFQSCCHISFTLKFCRVTKASGCGCGASSTARQLHRVRGLDEWRRGARPRPVRGPTTLPWTSGWSATSCCGPSSTWPAPTATRNFSCCFCINSNQTAIVLCLFYLLCFVGMLQSEPGPGQCILMGDLWIAGRMFRL